jgi:hypothetical protein
MKKLEHFDLSSRAGRYAARKAGFDVPKQKPGRVSPPFWSFVDKTGDCWIWNGRRNVDGYGIYCKDGKGLRAHRVAWEMQHGVEIGDCVAMHTCDTPACCNPAHIVLGTHRDNQLDKAAKNRQAKGDKSGTAKLTEAQVIEMRSRYRPRDVTYLDLSRAYGVSKDAAQKAIRGINWKHV